MNSTVLYPVYVMIYRDRHLDRDLRTHQVQTFFFFFKLCQWSLLLLLFDIFAIYTTPLHTVTMIVRYVLLG